MGTIFWIVGILTGATWSIINFLLIVVILQTTIVKRDTQKLWVLLLVKFPVLYLLGFVILISRIFPAISLLVGATATLAVLGIVKLCQKPA
jgi:hypothetical protein